jgi:hypothetical protein
VLDELRDRDDACGVGELSELGELSLAVDPFPEDTEDEPALRRRPRGGIGLARGHEGDYAPQSGSPTPGR